MTLIKAFVAGFIATLVFHQGLYTLLYLAGIAPSPPFNMAATEPLKVPAVISLAFWGGVWAVALWPVIVRFAGAARLGVAALLGAIGPSAVAMLVVFPLKGLPVTGQIVVGALLLNAAWGLGVCLLMRVLNRSASSV